MSDVPESRAQRGESAVIAAPCGKSRATSPLIVSRFENSRETSALNNPLLRKSRVPRERAACQNGKSRVCSALKTLWSSMETDRDWV